MKIEKKFHDTFNDKLGQVFLYLIDECNLNCKHCLYKSEITFQLNKTMISFENSVYLMKNLYELGARKLTFMGGEPTLHPNLMELIHTAKLIGYSYIRMDTNGQFQNKLLDEPYLQEIDEITFSLDGFDSETNDFIRGVGSFSTCVENIKVAVKKRFNVHVTHCVHSIMTKKNEDKLGLLKMIELCENLGVKKLNVHSMIDSGIPRDNWSNKIGTSIEEYLKAYEAVSKFKQTQNHIDIRMPQCFITLEQFNSNPEYYEYCSVKQFDRILAFPNGMLRICSLMIGTPYCIGYYNNKEMYLNTNPTNETLGHILDKYTKCTNQGKGKHFVNYVPLCVSFKPQQNEPIWINKLNWESKKRHSD